MFESSLFLWIIIFSTLGSIGAIGGAALLLLFPDSMRKRLLPCLLSYATGTLLGAAFLGMIPEAMEQAQRVNSLHEKIPVILGYSQIALVPLTIDLIQYYPDVVT